MHCSYPLDAVNTMLQQEKIRTLQVVNVRWFNATAWYGFAVARLMRQAGHESLVLGLADTESFEKAVELGLEPVALSLNIKSPLSMVSLYGAMRKLVREFRPHIVNCHRGEAYPLWAALRATEGFALVRTRGDQRLPKGNLPNKVLHQHMADAVIATNSRMARHMVEKMGVPHERLHTILGGVEEKFYHYNRAGRQQVRASFGWTDEHFVVGLLGRFDEVKAQRETIQAVARLRRSGVHNIRLMLAGFATATSLAEVEGWIAEAGIADITVITGKCDDVTACIAAMDLGIVPSLWSETIARAAVEIMAAGVPLISSTVGVMPDLLPEDAMFSPGNIPAMEAMLARAMHDVAWRESVREHCMRRMSTLRDVDFYHDTLAVYHEAILRRHGGVEHAFKR